MIERFVNGFHLRAVHRHVPCDERPQSMPAIRGRTRSMLPVWIQYPSDHCVIFLVERAEFVHIYKISVTPGGPGQSSPNWGSSSARSRIPFGGRHQHGRSGLLVWRLSRSWSFCALHHRGLGRLQIAGGRPAAFIVIAYGSAGIATIGSGCRQRMRSNHISTMAVDAMPCSRWSFFHVAKSTASHSRGGTRDPSQPWHNAS